MLIAKNGVDHVSAPADYHELYRKYYGFVVALVQKHGISESNAEDVASEILERFWERDFLKEFNPEAVFEHDGVRYPARFKSFLSKFVIAYLPGHRDRQTKRTHRELLIMDMPIADGNANAETSKSNWGEQHGGETVSAEDEFFGAAAIADLLDYMRGYLDNLPAHSKIEGCDLSALFSEMLRQIDTTGGWENEPLRERFNVSSTCMHQWTWVLRRHLVNAMNRNLPAKRVQRDARMAA